MVAKLFVINSFGSQKHQIIKKNKFFVYENNVNTNNKNNYEKNNKSENRTQNNKFKIYKSRGIKIHKLIKNNKRVFVNCIYSDIFLKNSNQKNKKNLYKKTSRNSSYRGVSKNGNKWQALLMNNKNRYYLGNYNSEETAAKVYDFFSIKFLGKKATTNFFYDDEYFKKIYEIEFNN